MQIVHERDGAYSTLFYQRTNTRVISQLCQPKSGKKLFIAVSFKCQRDDDITVWTDEHRKPVFTLP